MVELCRTGTTVNFDLPQGVGADMRAEVEEPRAVAADLGPDAPDVVLVEVEEVEAGGVLEDWPGVVVAPQEVVSHLVSLQ